VGLQIPRSWFDSDLVLNGAVADEVIALD
jgi:hypothetical protein